MRKYIDSKAPKSGRDDPKKKRNDRCRDDTPATRDDDSEGDDEDDPDLPPKDDNTLPSGAISSIIILAPSVGTRRFISSFLQLNLTENYGGEPGLTPRVKLCYH